MGRNAQADLQTAILNTFWQVAILCCFAHVRKAGRPRAPRPNTGNVGKLSQSIHNPHAFSAPQAQAGGRSCGSQPPKGRPPGLWSGPGAAAMSAPAMQTHKHIINRPQLTVRRMPRHLLGTKQHPHSNCDTSIPIGSPYVLNVTYLIVLHHRQHHLCMRTSLQLVTGQNLHGNWTCMAAPLPLYEPLTSFWKPGRRMRLPVTRKRSVSWEFTTLGTAGPAQHGCTRTL